MFSREVKTSTTSRPAEEKASNMQSNGWNGWGNKMKTWGGKWEEEKPSCSLAGILPCLHAESSVEPRKQSKKCNSKIRMQYIFTKNNPQTCPQWSHLVPPHHPAPCPVHCPENRDHNRSRRCYNIQRSINITCVCDQITRSLKREWPWAYLTDRHVKNTILFSFLL